jgi:hypothetical protein
MDQESRGEHWLEDRRLTGTLQRSLPGCVIGQKVHFPESQPAAAQNGGGEFNEHAGQSQVAPETCYRLLGHDLI